MGWVRVLVVVVWVGVLVLILEWSYTESAPSEAHERGLWAVTFALVASFAAGLLVGRWWVLLVPVTLWLLWTMWVLVTALGGEDWRDTGPVGIVLVATYGLLLVTAPAALGVAWRRVNALERRRAREKQEAAKASRGT